MKPTHPLPLAPRAAERAPSLLQAGVWQRLAGVAGVLLVLGAVLYAAIAR